jgi:hypothetical protein
LKHAAETQPLPQIVPDAAYFVTNSFHRHSLPGMKVSRVKTREKKLRACSSRRARLRLFDFWYFPRATLFRDPPEWRGLYSKSMAVIMQKN